MRTVEDESGRRYLLLKRSSASSLVHDLETGEERFVETDRLVDRAGVDPLAAAAEAIPPADRASLPVARDERGVGLLVLLAREPRSARTLLNATDLCESDLLGLASELRAAGLLAETTVDGERGYVATEAGRAAIDAAQSASASGSERSD